MLGERLGQLREELRRAVRGRGRERERAVLILRSVVASTLAWAVAALVMDSSQVAFAPFSALLVVRPSVYRSVLDSSRYVAAVFLGVLAAGAAGLTVGVHLWAFALVVLVALVVGQASLFRDQGRQIPVVAAFAFAGGTAASVEPLGEILIMVCVGSASALLTQLVLAPSVRFRDAEDAVHGFADSLAYLVDEIAAGLHEGREGLDTRRWVRIAQSLTATRENARAAVEAQDERVRFNPRKLLMRNGSTVSLRTYREWINAMDRASWHLRSITSTLDTLERGPRRLPPQSEDFLHVYGDLLDAVSDVLWTLHEDRAWESDQVPQDLSRRLECAQDAVDRCQRELEHTRGGSDWHVRGALLTDVERLLHELSEGRTGAEQG
ncbi:aromatic acid exporter family protein [Nocardiopsis sp. NRRL B-16309]|uniref:aromatic acid exporter family protein n=1 Tax=Nocardiopsis sp. NRRL B-16309 TaxID=1519494 RepID=UPI000A40FE54|nr:aromatic acid exporter family protein [Nocardiopsis sp. NRRL B-16309]